MPLTVKAEVIDHKDQRYNTIGDWQKIGDQRSFDVHIKVSDLGDRDMNFLVLIHELVEAYLCQKTGVEEYEVDKWDKEHEESNDPGSLDGCPYLLQHNLASIIEKQMADFLGVNWQEYEANIFEVSYE